VDHYIVGPVIVLIRLVFALAVYHRIGFSWLKEKVYGILFCTNIRPTPTKDTVIKKRAAPMIIDPISLIIFSNALLGPDRMQREVLDSLPQVDFARFNPVTY
jgi:hypothetical protein